MIKSSFYTFHCNENKYVVMLLESARFYRALSMLGTDFSLMENLFPNRTRFELKRKFKVEERINQQLVDRTIASQKPFDPTVFGNETGDLMIHIFFQLELKEMTDSKLIPR